MTPTSIIDGLSHLRFGKLYEFCAKLVRELLPSKPECVSDGDKSIEVGEFELGHDLYRVLRVATSYRECRAAALAVVQEDFSSRATESQEGFSYSDVF